MVVDGSLFQNLRDFLDSSNVIVGAGTGPEDFLVGEGLRPRHAYAIKGIYNFGEKEMILLQNPQGDHNYRGKHHNEDEWDEEDQLKVQEARQQRGLTMKFDSRSMFWMELSMIRRYIEQIIVCFLTEENEQNEEGQQKEELQWRKVYNEEIMWEPNRNNGGCVMQKNRDTYFRNPQFEIEISENTEVLILLQQEENRRVSQEPFYEGIGFEIFSQNHQNMKTCNGLIPKQLKKVPKSLFQCLGGYQRNRQISLKKNLEKGKYTLFCSTYTPTVATKRFKLMIWSLTSNKDQDDPTIQVRELSLEEYGEDQRNFV